MLSCEEMELMRRIVMLVKDGNDVEISRTRDGLLKAFIVRKNKVAV